MQRPASGTEKAHAMAEASMGWLGSSFAEKNLEVQVDKELKRSEHSDIQQRAAAYWIVVRLANNSFSLSGTPKITSHSFGFPITRKTLTLWRESNGGLPK